MSGNYPRLEFSMKLAVDPKQWEFTEGVLLIKKNADNAGVKLKATSGLAGYQKSGDWRIKGRGCIPPSKQLIPHQWSVSTLRLFMPDVRGVEGSFYQISPFEIRLPGVVRGDFGIHADAGFPHKTAGNAGSAGCIVIRDQSHWDLFRQQIELFKLDGIQQIPLSVEYS